MENKLINTTDEVVDVTVQGIPMAEGYRGGYTATGGVQQQTTGAANIYGQSYHSRLVQHGHGETSGGIQGLGTGMEHYTGPASSPNPLPQPNRYISPGGVSYMADSSVAGVTSQGAGAAGEEQSGEGAVNQQAASGAEVPLPQPVAAAPPHVMTALGPMPLPPEIRKRIPEKFVAKPIIEEREIFVAKKEIQERTIEVPHVQYDHRFTQIAKQLSVKKLVPSVKEIVREVPREVYKPVIEEKVIEVPQGVKYVEVPVEVACFYPPKIVPVAKEHIVERIVETIKPIVKEKIIEVPQTVVKNVPKIKTVEVPYFVPRYVEKVIEVPYEPPATGSFLPSLTGALPPSMHGNFPGQAPFSQFNDGGELSVFPPSFAGAPAPSPFSLGPIPLSGVNELRLPYEAKVEVRVANAENRDALMQSSRGMNIAESSTLQQSSNFQAPFELPEGVQWGAPPGAPPLDPHSMPQCFDYPAAGKIPPMMVTFPPEVGKVSYSGKGIEPNILTRAGVMPYQQFKSAGNAQILFPPLQPHSLVPMQEGVPDVQHIQSRAQAIASTRGPLDGAGHVEGVAPPTNGCGFFQSDCCS